MKTRIQTMDTFEFKSPKVNKDRYNYCKHMAEKCGLEYSVYNNADCRALMLMGSRWSFLKYYFTTIEKGDIWSSVKRLVQIAFCK